MATQTTTPTPKSPDELALVQWEGSKLRPIVETHATQILAAAGDTMRPMVEQSAAAFKSALRRLMVTNPPMFRDIAMQNPVSVRDAVEYVCALGLRIGQGYDAHMWLIPRKLKGVPTLCVQIGTRGLQVLADRAGWRVKAISVSYADVEEGRLVLRDADVSFNRNPLSEPLEGWSDPVAAWDQLAGFVVFAGRHGSKMSDGHWVPKGVIARRRAMSHQSEGGFWKQWPIEMARGVAIRDTCKQIGGDTDLGIRVQQITTYEGDYLRAEEAPPNGLASIRAMVAEPPAVIETQPAEVQTPAQRAEPVQTQAAQTEPAKAQREETPEEAHARREHEQYLRENPQPALPLGAK